MLGHALDHEHRIIRILIQAVDVGKLLGGYLRDRLIPLGGRLGRENLFGGFGFYFFFFARLGLALGPPPERVFRLAAHRTRPRGGWLNSSWPVPCGLRLRLMNGTSL